MLASVLRLAAATPKPLVIGQAYAGGYYGGSILISGTVYNLVVAPATGGYDLNTYKTANTAETGLPADNAYYGLTSTNLYADANHPAFQWAAALTIGGFTDWYIPARYELEIIYRNLKPSTASNSTADGANPYANPTPTTNYTASVPGQTTALAFRSGGSQAFVSDLHLTATQVTNTEANAYSITFQTGALLSATKTSGRYVRAIRRVVA